MASCGDADENTNESELNLVMVSIIKDYPILVEKSQLPSAKEKKASALKAGQSAIYTNTGKLLDGKQILKKISNMKSQVKKKTDGNQTGNRKIILSSWEQKLYEHLQGDENSTIMKMACSISTGFGASGSFISTPRDHQSQSSCSSSKNSGGPIEPSSSNLQLTPAASSSNLQLTPASSRSTTPVAARVPTKRVLSAETEETKTLSTPELQRLVLLEQLRYTRAKMRRFEQQNDQQTTDAAAVAPANTLSFTNLDTWQDDLYEV